MYFSSNRFNGRKNNFGGNFSRPQSHRPKTFNPTLLIANMANQQVLSQTVQTVEEKFAPSFSFNDLPIDQRLKENIVKKGYIAPTPIQDQAIKPILEGRDVVGIANTGSGKTAAFLIPLINKAVLNRNQRFLIIAPTRELAVQIRDELVQFSLGMNIDSVLCIGGVSIQPQAMRLRRNPQFVIGTPGRIKDLEGGRSLNFAFFQNIVLDEVDRMLDIGFLKEIQHIIAKLPPVRQSLFFSATLPLSVNQVMQSLLRNPVQLSVKASAPVMSVKQEVVRTAGKMKIEVLHDLLIKEECTKVLVFGRTKHGIEKLERDLDKRGFKVASIHGNKNQNQRQRALNDFKNDFVQVLLATDIVARGLDISNVSHVINYELPESMEDYIHRIGRTGRADKTGVALTFVD